MNLSLRPRHAGARDAAGARVKEELMQVDSAQSVTRRAWMRWTLASGLPSSLVALGSVWLYEPDSQAKAIAAAGVGVAALFVFVLTMPHAAQRARRSRRASPDDPA
ncbi:hypothetical protein [Streptomyces sp. NPDC047525]|uniref:hypothetical protein n=1 Tax=Streptomyces sp. NPDC047525 TaxID=3155264 RepID=UPI0033E8CC63